MAYLKALPSSSLSSTNYMQENPTTNIILTRGKVLKLQRAI